MPIRNWTTDGSLPFAHYNKTIEFEEVTNVQKGEQRQRQHMVHAEMCDNWGYEELDETIQARAITKMRHAEKLIARILFLGGKPIVSKLNPIHIGADVAAQHQNDWQAERDAIDAYNKVIGLTVELGDNGTRELLESILVDEEDHIDWIEAHQDQIAQMGIENYLAQQID